MTAEEFEARIIAWARRQTDVLALIQIGSRVQAAGSVDDWSDWDFHLIARDPARFNHVRWPEDIAPCWNVHLEQTERGVRKLSMVAAGGWEADFVLLAAWQMKLVYRAMAHPGARRFYPRSLVDGIYGTRLFVQPGYRVLVGGAAWEKRLAALAIDWPPRVLTEQEFHEVVAGFWRHAVWIYKKTMRGELRAALRGLQRELVERRFILLAEEARLAGKSARPEARKAEQWLPAERQAQTSGATSPEQRSLAGAILAEMDIFEQVSRNVANGHGFAPANTLSVAGWLRTELNRIA